MDKDKKRDSAVASLVHARNVRAARHHPYRDAETITIAAAMWLFMFTAGPVLMYWFMEEVFYFLNWLGVFKAIFHFTGW